MGDAGSQQKHMKKFIGSHGWFCLGDGLVLANGEMGEAVLEGHGQPEQQKLDGCVGAATCEEDHTGAFASIVLAQDTVTSLLGSN